MNILFIKYFVVGLVSEIQECPYSVTFLCRLKYIDYHLDILIIYKLNICIGIIELTGYTSVYSIHCIHRIL